MEERIKWGCVWTGWAAYFAVAETVALRGKHPDAPLSAHLRRVLGADHPEPLRRLAGALTLASGSAWLIVHVFRGVSQS